MTASFVKDPVLNSRGNDRVQIDPPEGSRLEVISPNWCDKTTWFEESVEVTDEALTDSGDGLTFNPATARVWVDVMHGKLTGERELRESHQPQIEVDGSPVEENSPGATDKDYSINYSTGAVTFNSSQSGKTVVAKRYHYENGATFTVAPIEGKILRITQIEVQFSENVELNDTVLFQLYVGGNPYGDPTVYQTMMDFINEASLAYPSIPKMGGSSWRGMKGAVHIFRWPYSERGATDLKASLGMAIKIKLEGNNEFGGDVAVATVYGISESES
jgi:hypothetical protein